MFWKNALSERENSYGLTSISAMPIPLPSTPRRRRSRSRRDVPPGRGGNRDRDRADRADGAAPGGPHGEIDLAARDRERPPFGGEAEAVLVVPPHVVAARVDQLELELVGGRHPVDVEGEGISFRQWEREALARDDEATAAFEIEVEPQGAASGPSIRGNIELRLS